ncbi:MAG: hypothetical protein JSR37_05185 [Verrucomicrobia bacterium]|nr:hypothetical protein [Verrucomicrobiota bacterium]MBS0636919.1 hypothetical protein [Verrucomicrobiota bacterium]
MNSQWEYLKLRMLSKAEKLLLLKCSLASLTPLLLQVDQLQSALLRSDKKYY